MNWECKICGSSKYITNYDCFRCEGCSVLFAEPLKIHNSIGIDIVYHSDDVPIIKKIDGGDWIDLAIATECEMFKGDFKLLSLGVSMRLPKGYEANIVPRSSTFKRYGIIQTNHYGVIDNSYCGTTDIWHFPAYATRDIFIPKGTRICQFKVMKNQPKTIVFNVVSSLKNDDRGGFGSTGL